MRLIALGKIVAAHGLGGFVRVRSFNRPVSPNLAAAQEVYLGADPTEPRAVEAVRPHPQGALIKLAGIDTRTAAEALVGRAVSVPASALPEPGRAEFYYYEVVGFRVRTTAGVELGTIRETFPTGGNDVWVVVDDGREHLIPVIADALPGLLDL
jgi:16S rRNA processing protein RimM